MSGGLSPLMVGSGDMQSWDDQASSPQAETRALDTIMSSEDKQMLGYEPAVPLESVEEVFREGMPREDAPQEDVPREDALREDVPLEDVPLQDAPLEDARREEEPREEVSREEVPREEVPREELSREDASREEVPPDEAPPDEAPLEEVREDVPREDMPREDVLQEDVLREDVPGEDGKDGCDAPATPATSYVAVEIEAEIPIEAGTEVEGKMEAELDVEVGLVDTGEVAPSTLAEAYVAEEPLEVFEADVVDVTEVATSSALLEQDEAKQSLEGLETVCVSPGVDVKVDPCVEQSAEESLLNDTLRAQVDSLMEEEIEEQHDELADASTTLLAPSSSPKREELAEDVTLETEGGLRDVAIGMNGQINGDVEPLDYVGSDELQEKSFHDGPHLQESGESAKGDGDFSRFLVEEAAGPTSPEPYSPDVESEVKSGEDWMGLHAYERATETPIPKPNTPSRVGLADLEEELHAQKHVLAPQQDSVEAQNWEEEEAEIDSWEVEESQVENIHLPSVGVVPEATENTPLVDACVIQVEGGTMQELNDTLCEESGMQLGDLQLGDLQLGDLKTTSENACQSWPPQGADQPLLADEARIPSPVSGRSFRDNWREQSEQGRQQQFVNQTTPSAPPTLSSRIRAPPVSRARACPARWMFRDEWNLEELKLLEICHRYNIKQKPGLNEEEFYAVLDEFLGDPGLSSAYPLIMRDADWNADGYVSFVDASYGIRAWKGYHHIQRESLRVLAEIDEILFDTLKEMMFKLNGKKSIENPEIHAVHRDATALGDGQGPRRTEFARAIGGWYANVVREPTNWKYIVWKGVTTWIPEGDHHSPLCAQLSRVIPPVVQTLSTLGGGSVYHRQGVDPPPDVQSVVKTSIFGVFRIICLGTLLVMPAMLFALLVVISCTHGSNRCPYDIDNLAVWYGAFGMALLAVNWADGADVYASPVASALKAILSVMPLLGTAYVFRISDDDIELCGHVMYSVSLFIWPTLILVESALIIRICMTIRQLFEQEREVQLDHNLDKSHY